MKKHLFPVLMICALATLVFVACTTTVVDPVTGKTTHVADTNAITNAAGQVKAVNDATKPFNPYAPIIDPAIPIGTTVAFALSNAWAAFLNWRNKKALVAVVKGVEEFSESAPKSTLKDLIFDQSKAAGVAGHLANVVEIVTNPPKPEVK